MRTTEEHYAHFHKVAQACFWHKKRPRTLLNEVYYTTDFIYLFSGGSDGTRTRGLWRDSLAPVLYLGVFEGNTRTFFLMLMVTEYT